MSSTLETVLRGPPARPCRRPPPHRTLLLQHQRLRLRFERLHTLLVQHPPADCDAELEAEAIAEILTRIDRTLYRLEVTHGR